MGSFVVVVARGGVEPPTFRFSLRLGTSRWCQPTCSCVSLSVPLMPLYAPAYSLVCEIGVKGSGDLASRMDAHASVVPEGEPVRGGVRVTARSAADRPVGSRVPDR